MGKKVLCLSLFGTGIFMLIQVVMPIISFKFWEFSLYNQNQVLLTPHPDKNTLGISIKNINSFPTFYSTNNRNTISPYSEFRISIPAIKLENIKVIVDTNEFEENLAHLPGTSLPGEKGNAFISGHSSLPQFFKSENFKAIFSNLPKIKKGDQVLVEVGGQKFTYKVISLNIVDPKEVWVINPPDRNGRYLTLMTCVPPGLYLKRLIVLTELQSS